MLYTPIIALLAILTSAQALAAEPDFTALAREQLLPIVEAEHAPGMAVGLLREGTSVTLGIGTLSYDSQTVPDERTVYEIGSISKVFTAMLLAETQARGSLHENDPLAQHLPEGVVIDEFDAAANPIRLVHLASHASGLARMPSNIRPADPMNPFADYDRERLFAQVHDMVPIRPPGAGYTYSNFASGLLGTVLELAADQPYESLMHERITGPLGMEDTVLRLREEQLARLAPPFAGTTPNANWDFQSMAGAGGIRSTVADLLVFAQASIEAVQTPDQSSDEAEADGLPESLRTALRETQKSRFSLGNGQPNVALGWHLAGPLGEIIWHNGMTGGYASFLGLHPESGTALVILANGNADAVTAAGFELLREMVEQDQPEDS